MSIEHRVWLAVPPEQFQTARDAAGLLPDGRRAITWSKEDKLWYALPGADIDRVRQWLPDRSIRSGGGDPQSEFWDALTAGGLVLDDLPMMDGRRHRVPVLEGKKGNRDGVYRGFLNGRPAGWFINYHRAENDKDITRWKSSSGEKDPVVRLHIRAAMRQSKDDFAREQAGLYARQTASAKALYDRLPAADPAHGYLMRKGVTADPDLRQTRNGALVVPFFDVDGQFRTLQYIPPEGEKYLFKDAPKSGHFKVVGGELKNGEPILYAEGYATARSLNMVTSSPVVMTIDAGNMLAVALNLKARYPDSPHLFMADVDHAKEKNKGVLSAQRAADATGGAVLQPDLTAQEIERGFTDYNDLHHSRGAERLRETLLPDITDALEWLINYRDLPMRTPNDAQPTPASTPAVNSDAIIEPSRRRPGAAKEKTDEVIALRDQGMKPAQIAEQLGIGQTSVYRILRAQRTATPEAQNAGPMQPATGGAEPAVPDVSPAEAKDNAVATNPALTIEQGLRAPADSETTGPVEPVVASVSAQHAPSPDVPGAAEEKMDAAAKAAALSAQGISLVSIAAEMKMGMGETYRLMQQVKAENMPETAAAQAPDPDFKNAFADIAGRLQTLLSESERLDSQDLTNRLLSLMVERKQLTGIWMSSDEYVMSAIPDSTCLALEKQLLERLMPAEEVTGPVVTPASPRTAALAEENAIFVGAPRVRASDEDVPEALKHIDADKLLSRMTFEKQPDGKSVVYKLDGEHAFTDFGNRLVMANGASAHEEKVLAALLTAAQHYHGRIELTGSDEFKAFAINLIVANKLDVSMKSASQQADLDTARRAAGQPVVPVDAVAGTPEAHKVDVAATARAAESASSLVTPASPSALPVTMSHKQASVPISPPVPEKPEINPGVHTPAEKAREPVTGKVTACGQAPFRFEPDADESTFITLRTKSGPQTYWGKELAGLLRETNLKPGRMVTLQWQGKQPVTVKVPRKNEHGVITHYDPVETHRNQWSLTPLGGNRVQTGGDELVKLSAFDAGRFTQVQQVVVSRLQLDMPAPPVPTDGLYWLRPDGQGSVISGDALSAERPAQNNRAGEPVMSSWAPDGTPDLYLAQGDGNYLQGVVRQAGTYQHVLVSLPGSKEAPPMVFNQLTPEGAVPIGSGNGINRSNGQPVPRENVVVRLTGDEQQRIARLDSPAELPPTLHARLGFDERWKSEVTLPKERPAATPQAAPVSPSRPA